MKQSQAPTSMLRKITHALVSGDYSLAHQVCCQAKHHNYARDRGKQAIVPPPKWDFSYKLEDNIKAAIETWVYIVQDDANPFGIAANVISNKEFHPLWRERAIALLANNELGAEPNDSRFAEANVWALLFSVPAEHPNFNALAANYAQYCSARSSDPKYALEMLLPLFDRDGEMKKAARIRELSAVVSKPERPLHLAAAVRDQPKVMGT